MRGRDCSFIAIVFVLAGRWICAEPVQTGKLTSGSIEGRVLGNDGAPSSGLRIAAMSIPDESDRKTREVVTALTSIATTAEDGHYTLSDIPPGRYFVVTGPLNDLVFLAQMNVTPASKLNAGDSRISSPLVYKIRGRVVRERNIAGDSILLDGPEWIQLSAPIASDGSFEFAAVRPGVYTARVIPDISLPEVELFVDRDIADVTIPIPLSAVKDVQVEFLTDIPGGGLMPRIKLRLALTKPAEPDLPLPPWYNNGIVDIQAGQFSQRLPLGEYEVLPAFIALPAGYTVKAIQSGSTDLLKDSLTVTALGIPRIVITLSVSSPFPWGRVEGRLTGLDQLKIRPNRILIASPEVASTLVSDIGPDGRFEFPSALPGIYEVVLSPAPDTLRRTLTIERVPVTRVEIPAIPR